MTAIRPTMRTHARRIGIALFATGALALAGCSSSGGDSGGAVDCAKATAAIEAYSAALGEMVLGLSSEDADAARAGAQKLGPAALEVTRSLPGLPPEAESFATISENGARLVEDSLSSGVAPATILEELDPLFSDEAFTKAGDALDDAYKASCPNSTPQP